MNSRDRKRAILHQLSQQSEALSLDELMAKLSLDCSERTVRRLLNELVAEGLVAKSGTTKNAQYFASRNYKKEIKDIRSCFGSKSLEAISMITRPLYQRRPVAYNEDWFNSYAPNQTFYLPSSLRKELLQAGKRATDHDPAGTYAHKIYNRLLIDLSYNSSRLEGNTYSLLDTEKLLLHGDTAEGKLDEEKVMILNHKEAIRYLVDHASKLEADVKTICTLHYLLSDGLVEPQYAGKVRDHGVRIQGSTYIPFENPETLALQLKKIAKKAMAIENPFEKSFFLLVHISYLQAFIDVNKRTARLCSNIPLITENLVPSSFNDIEREDYMSSMIAIYELQNIHPMIDLFVFSYLRTCSAYDSTIKSFGFDEIRIRYRSVRRQLIREIITSSMTGPALTAYVTTFTKKEIPPADRAAFMKNVKEDLEQINESRIAGLGITPKELQSWLLKTPRKYFF